MFFYDAPLKKPRASGTALFFFVGQPSQPVDFWSWVCGVGLRTRTDAFLLALFLPPWMCVKKCLRAAVIKGVHRGVLWHEVVDFLLRGFSQAPAKSLPSVCRCTRNTMPLPGHPHLAKPATHGALAAPSGPRHVCDPTRSKATTHISFMCGAGILARKTGRVDDFPFIFAHLDSRPRVAVVIFVRACRLVVVFVSCK